MDVKLKMVKKCQSVKKDNSKYANEILFDYYLKLATSEDAIKRRTMRQVNDTFWPKFKV